MKHPMLPSGNEWNMAGWKISELNGGLENGTSLISIDLYGPFSSTTCLMTPEGIDHEPSHCVHENPKRRSPWSIHVTSQAAASRESDITLRKWSVGVRTGRPRFRCLGEDGWWTWMGPEHGGHSRIWRLKIWRNSDKTLGFILDAEFWDTSEDIWRDWE